MSKEHTCLMSKEHNEKISRKKTSQLTRLYLLRPFLCGENLKECQYVIEQQLMGPNNWSLKAHWIKFSFLRMP